MPLAESGHSFQSSAGSSNDTDDDTDAVTLKPTSPGFQYSALDADEQENGFQAQSDDYSSRLDEILGDEEDELHTHDGESELMEDEDDEGFFYHGEDAARERSYKDHLRDVLGPDASVDDADEPSTPLNQFHIRINTNDDDEEFSYEEESRNVSFID